MALLGPPTSGSMKCWICWGEDLPKGEIARRLKISPAAVSQRINKISSMLEEGLNLDRQ